MMNDGPFTAIVCQHGPCTVRGEELLERLRPAVRDSPHGVLVRAGCLLAAEPRCTAPPGHDSGAYMLVQPCDRDRRPRAMPVAVGPVLSDADADAVADWLAGENLDVGQRERLLQLLSAVLPAAQRRTTPGDGG
jgi:hypothetical protein